MSKLVFGIDLGGTTIKFGLIKESGDLVDKWEIPTDTSTSGKNILSDIAREVQSTIEERNLDRNDIIGIGIGVPGPVNDQGVVLRCVNLGWDVVHVSEELSALTGFLVKAGNDANVAALGEVWKGGAKGYKNAVLFTLGTGVGGGVIVNEEMVNGQSGAAGELGHMTIVFHDAEKCACGKLGCLETVASATGIVRETKKYLERTDEASVLRNIDSITAKAIFDEAKNGDLVAIEMVEQLGRYLGLAISHVANIMDPEIILIGGGVSKAGSYLLEAIRKYYRQYAFHALTDTKFAIAMLENDAGMMGAAKLIIGH